MSREGHLSYLKYWKEDTSQVADDLGNLVTNFGVAPQEVQDYLGEDEVATLMEAYEILFDLQEYIGKLI